MSLDRMHHDNDVKLLLQFEVGDYYETDMENDFKNSDIFQKLRVISSSRPMLKK